MKKRVLSALLALSTLLITTPAAYAAEPATQSGGAEIDWPEPTCTVDYKPQSDTVSCEFVEETGDAPAKLVYTIQEVRDHITRYGIGRASEDVKAVAREMTAEEFSSRIFKDKYAALKRIADYYPQIYGIIFCRTKVA